MIKLIVGEGSCGISAGAAKVYDSLEKELEAEKVAELGITGCIGMCFLEPIVDIYKDEELAARLVHVKPEQAADIVKAVKDDDLDSLAELKIKDEDKVYLEEQTRIALRHCADHGRGQRLHDLLLGQYTRSRSGDLFGQRR